MIICFHLELKEDETNCESRFKMVENTQKTATINDKAWGASTESLHIVHLTSKRERGKRNGLWKDKCSP